MAVNSLNNQLDASGLGSHESWLGLEAGESGLKGAEDGSARITSQDS